ncbi:N-acetylglucosamine/diacetylchitobiose ABC transporter substrate-binding protein [Spelaeicoccus albus]|uniref:N-acetylglucosamine transport system substrate-binding protein n=1 Tax=Spelaeicoccus albus TaxID=1280376 RepID=A0A7Z0ABY8_9MICO|nr:N-acetylglucosamine/diacetylchitobiose ABC transporter substrate-binding protein [Spelaeicoccus albus]NYI67290.1 N-acetylglucosamine transport system substrate-binding protein [Spelaeicoccus albus]
MKIQDQPLARRNVMRAALASAVAVPIGASMASCATGGGSDKSDKKGSSGKKSEKNPFGMAADSTIDAVIFKGGYGIEYAKFAGKIVKKDFPKATVKVSPQTNIAQTLQPRFVSGNPPDLIDNSGANLISFQAILDQLEDLTDVTEAKNLEGKVIKDTLYGGALAPGMFGDKLASINYVLTVYGIWYSKTLFDKHGWKTPKTWDEMFELGKKAKKANKYLFCWGKEAATYYLTMCIASAIKEGGDPVRLKLGNLKPNCWSDDSVQGVLKAMKKIIDADMVKPGGAGTQFTAAQAQWSNAEDAILYPSGGWIENEMKDQTKKNFKMTGFTEPTLTSDSKFPYDSLHSAGGEGYIVPSQGKNVPGGKEFLRTMLSKQAATNFSKTVLSPTIVKDLVPPDGFGSTALVSQTKMLDAAGDNVFTWKFVDNYGMNDDLLTLWNAFLAGKSSVAKLTAGMQKITDKVRNDKSVKKIKVT